MPKNTISVIALALAEKIVQEKYELMDAQIQEKYDVLDAMFKEKCELLDSRIQESMQAAFGDERISQVRMQRIMDRFCDCMLQTKEEKLDETNI